MTGSCWQRRGVFGSCLWAAHRIPESQDQEVHNVRQVLLRLHAQRRLDLVQRIGTTPPALRERGLLLDHLLLMLLRDLLLSELS